MLLRVEQFPHLYQNIKICYSLSISMFKLIGASHASSIDRNGERII